MSVFLNEADYERTLAAAQRASSTVPAYLRTLATGAMPPTTETDQRVNALANVANRIESARRASDVDAARKDLDAALELIRTLLNEQIEASAHERSQD